MGDESEEKMGGIVDRFLPDWVVELKKHLHIDPQTGKRTVTLPNLTITFDPPEGAL